MSRDEPRVEDVRIALHSLKGSASMAGHPDLALVASQLEVRIREGEVETVTQAVSILRKSALRMKDGLEPFASHWPIPPEGLEPAKLDPASQRAYLDAIRERLEELGSLATGSEIEEVDGGRAYRVVHSMKAVAGAFGDDLTAWYCHHLESFIGQDAFRSLSVPEMRDVLGRHYTALCRLTSSTGDLGVVTQAARTSSPRSHNRPSSIPSAEAAPAEEPSVRMSATTMTRLFDHLQRVDLAAEELAHTQRTAERVARSLGELRHELGEVSRLMGPPKPWSASARTLRRLHASTERAAGLLEEVERVGRGCVRCADTLRGEHVEMRRELGALQRTHLGWLFARIEQAAMHYARAAAKSVIVEFRGGDLTLDRAVGERLLQPLLQVVKNAVSHGIETPETRISQGKPAAGLLRVVAERDGDWMRLAVEDDGSGIDLMQVRRRAVATGAVGSDAAKKLTDTEVYALLFAPGFSTRSDADLLAGRGVGLELAEQVVEELGGEIRVTNRPSGGVCLVLELPGERGLVDVVWLEVDNRRFALPVAFAGRLTAANPRRRAPSLSRLVGLAEGRTRRWEMELLIPLTEPWRVGVDDLGDLEGVLVRPIPKLLSAAGPYVGVVQGGDGSLCFVLDAPRIAEGCRALGIHSPSPGNPH